MRVFDPRPDPRELRPEHALPTPTWLGALMLLVVNDHWLKGAGVVPGALTGKLSDFAGMLVAPVLLAVLLRVGTRRALLACHLAVGAVFAGIQLSPGFAELWSAAMGLLGYPWVITRDPTDLLALPFLGLSWALLVPAMDPERPALVGLRRSAVVTLSVVGLWSTVATSRDVGDERCPGCGWGTTGGWEEDTEGEPSWEEIFGDAYVHNPNTHDISITIRTLRPQIELDCAVLASDPGRLLPDAAFGEAQHWTLPPETNVAISTLAHPCTAALVAGEGIPEQLIFSSQSNPRLFPGSHATISELLPGGMAIVMDSDGGAWVGGEELRYTPAPAAAPEEGVSESCLPAPGESRLDWTDLPASITTEVMSIDAGLDGCHELELLLLGGGQTITWYMCAPESTMRLEVGSVYQLVSFELGDIDTVEARLADPLTHEVLVDDQGRELLTIRWARTRGQLDQLVSLVAAETYAQPECPWILADEDCPRVERGLGLGIDGGLQEVEPGVPSIHVDELGVQHELVLVRARWLALVDSACDPGAALRRGLEYALISEPAAP
jgi:hypothetical protein